MTGRRHDDQTQDRAARHETASRVDRRDDGPDHGARPPAPLTRQVLAEQLETATPAQMEFMHAWMNAEIESRERSKRARLLKQAGFPQSKELDGYDWTPLRFPRRLRAAGPRIPRLRRTTTRTWSCSARPAPARPTSPSALGRQACRQGIPARFFTAAELVMRLLRASAERQARPGALPDRQGQAPGRRRARIRPDRRGGQPPAVPGRHQRVRAAERRLHHQHRVQRMGQDLRRPQHGRRDHRPHRPPRQDDQIRGRLLPQDPRPHAITKQGPDTTGDEMD